MKPQALAELKNRAVTLAIETIRNRIDQLGVSEPVIQEHGLGQYQILVQLPGVDDPARVKEIMQSTAMLEIKQVAGRSLFERAGSLAAAQRRIASGFHAAAGPQRRRQTSDEAGEQWYLITRSSAVAGADLRSAAPRWDEIRTRIHPTWDSFSPTKADESSPHSPVRTSARNSRSCSTTGSGSGDHQRADS